MNADEKKGGAVPWWLQAVVDAPSDERKGYAVVALLLAACIGAVYLAGALRLMGWW